MGAPFESDDLTLRRRNPLATALAVALAAGGVLAALGLTAMTDWLPLLALAPIALVTALLFWIRNAYAIERLGRLSLGSLGVFFDGQRLAKRSAVRGAYIVLDGDDAPIVRLVTPGHDIDVRVRDHDAALRLIAAVRNEPVDRLVRLPSRVVGDPGQFARFGLYAVLLTLAFPIVGFAWHVHRGVALTMLAIAFAAVGALLAGFMSDTIVKLTADGIRIGWLRGHRFLFYRDLASIDLFDEAADLDGRRRQRVLVFTLRSGEVLRLPADEADTDALAELLQRSRKGLNQRVTTPVEQAIDRRGLAPREWMQALRALASGAGGSHRSAVIGDEALWQVVEDGGASEEARAAAAVALVATLGEGARGRLRIAAAEAPVRLRVALETAAEAATDADLEQALAEVALRRSPAPSSDAPDFRRTGEETV